MPITLEQIELGYRVWKGKSDDFDGFLLGNIVTKQFGGRDEQGNPIFRALDKKHWGIHFTSPHMTLDEIRAVCAVLPTEP